MCERGALLVLLLLDQPGESSLLQSKQVTFVGGKPQTSNYLDDYPFPFYVVLEDIRSLPEVLADALRQWYGLFMARNRRPADILGGAHARAQRTAGCTPGFQRLQACDSAMGAALVRGGPRSGGARPGLWTEMGAPTRPPRSGLP